MSAATIHHLRFRVASTRLRTLARQALPLNRQDLLVSLPSHGTISVEVLPHMYLRLAFWTLSLAYTSALLARTIPGSSPGIVLTAALFGAVFGLSFGALLINRRTRKRG